MMMAFHAKAYRWIDNTVFDLGRQLRWSYLPPLMVYLAAGVSSLTAIVGTFFVKEHFDLSAAFLASLGFWAGLPWALKMPLGHLVDLIWRWKAVLVYLGAALIALSIAIMYALMTQMDRMAALLNVETWYVMSVLLAPIGYVLQDVVADAMTVEAVPVFDEYGRPLSERTIKTMHTTMQTLGRVAIIAGPHFGGGTKYRNVFRRCPDVRSRKDRDLRADLFARLAIPAISVLGVTIGAVARQIGWHGYAVRNSTPRVSRRYWARVRKEPEPNWWIIGGGIAFVGFTLATGLAAIPFDQEIIFTGSMIIVLFLMRQLFFRFHPMYVAP